MKPADVTPPARCGHLARDPRGYPIMATVPRTPGGADFGALSERRKLALATFDWCGVCGLPFGTEARWQVSPTGASPELGHGPFGEAPVHEVCALYAAQVCPHLSSPGARLGDALRKGQVREPTVHATGFARTSSVEAFESGLQQGTFVLHFHHGGRVGSFAYARPDELAGRYHRLLATETIPPTSPAERELVRLFNEVSDADDTVVGAAVIAGAAFAPDVFRVQDMDPFDRYAFRTMAAMFLLDATAIREAAATIKDGAMRAVARWLLERGDDLPRILSGWRRAGRRQVQLVHAKGG
jgi:hypothetical protein